MHIKLFVRKLRNAADVLEELFITNDKKENKKTADKIRKKLHWTQLPKNRGKMLRNIRKMSK